MRLLGPTLVACAAALALAAAAPAAGDANVAAMQVGLRMRGIYAGPVDGVSGPATAASIRALQRAAGLPTDGEVGARTRGALGPFGRYRFGSRSLSRGAIGWDVAALQFLLAWHGFPSGNFDGSFAGHLDAALRRYQRWAGLTVDGVAGPGVFSSLRAAPPRCPIPVSRPLPGPIGDPFGPRGARFHTGVDFPAAAGTSVAAAAAGRVVYAGWLDGGWGNLVVLGNGHGVRTMYAHLSRIFLRIGQRVITGTPVGAVGATGDATGPHLHFEVRVRDAAVDPLPALR
jgi:murein DD-endopeptidase MepM/ murein hydrolase activator NlpD